jgi:hypothetical protein
MAAGTAVDKAACTADGTARDDTAAGTADYMVGNRAADTARKGEETVSAPLPPQLRHRLRRRTHRHIHHTPHSRSPRTAGSQPARSLRHTPHNLFRTRRHNPRTRRRLRIPIRRMDHKSRINCSLVPSVFPFFHLYSDRLLRSSIPVVSFCLRCRRIALSPPLFLRPVFPPSPLRVRRAAPDSIVRFP